MIVIRAVRLSVRSALIWMILFSSLYVRWSGAQPVALIAVWSELFSFLCVVLVVIDDGLVKDCGLLV